MKKLLLVITMSSLSMMMYGQKMDFWLDAGFKVQTGLSGLYNSAANSDNSFDLTPTSATKIGGKLGINFNYVGVSFDVMVGEQNGRYQNLDASAPPQPDTEISMNTTDIYVLFRSARNKGYFELGPKMSFVGNVSNSDNSPMLDELYESSALAGVLGFGTYILGPENGRFSGILGLRFEYGFQDIVSDAGSIAGETRQPVNYAGDLSTTNPIFVGLVFEFNWGIGGVGQARCGERSKFMWF